MPYVPVASQHLDKYTATRGQFIAYLEGLELAFMEVVEEVTWFRNLLSNVNLSGNEKTILYAIKRLSEEAERGDSDGFKQIARSEISKLSGISEQSISSALTKLDKSELVNRRIERTGWTSRELWLRLPKETLNHPRDVGFSLQDDENTWGGKRVKLCPECKSDNLEEKHFFVCKDCGCYTHPDQLLEVSERTLAAERELV